MADPCVILAQKLAGNEKKTRDRALRRLRAYLRERSGRFSSDEFCKIWKGLFYCMWMQDKPLLQEELARNMSQLVHMLHTRESRNLFLRAFWQTLNREWDGIDRLRLDKFYTLVRFVLNQSALLVQQADWEESMVEEFLLILVEEVLKTEASRGVQHHVIDIYLEELAKIGSTELTADVNLKLIEPFCKIAAKTKDAILQQSVVNGIFQIILDQAPFAIEELMKEVGHDPTDEETDGDGGSGSGGLPAQDEEDIGPVLQFDYQAVSDRLFGLASRQNIPSRNRKCLYRLVKRFKDLAEGVFPHDDFPEEVSTDEDDDEFSSWRFRKRQKKFEDRLMLEKHGFIPEPEKKNVGRGVQHPEIRRRRRERQRDRRLRGNVRRRRKFPRPGKEADHSRLNGRAESPPTEKTEDTKSKGRPAKAARSHDAAHIADTPSAKPVKKRRSRLLRLSLSVLPLRGVSLMRRRRALMRSRIIGNKPETSSVTTPATPPAKVSSTAKVTSTAQDFVAFRKSEAPKALYVKSSKTGGRQIRKDQNCNSKKVTFSLNKNMTAEFKRTDRSLLVSPTGSSRVPFNPDQRPQHGVLKTPSPVASRARASDFF
ncbi:LOW QUALITY PROTEIN: ribosomal RNA processing protein 1 homolog A-like [Lithobates pipiens]